MDLNKCYKALAFGMIFLLTTTACSDLLDLDNPNSLTSSTAYSTEEDINAALTGIYHSFYSSYYAMMSSNQFSGQSDEMTSYSVANIQQYVKHVYSNMNHLWNHITWNQLYEQIVRCNQVITYLENITEWGTYSKEQILAQAKAIRAYDYYQLVMLYKIPPYVDYVASAEDQPAAGDFDEICQHIIDDAKYAYETLPASYKSVDGYNECTAWENQYRATKWFAACVLAKTYMNWGDYLSGGYHYEEALPYYKDIVENGGFTLTVDYTSNVSISTENNSESIFEIQNAASSAYGWENYYGGTNNYTIPSQSMWRWKFYAAGPLGWSDYNSESWIVYAFKNEKAKNGQNGSTWDARIPATVFYSDIFNDFPEHKQWQTWTATEGKATSSSEISTSTPGFSYTDWNLSLVYINKYTAQYEDYVQVNSDNSEGTNNRIFRLGEIILDYAECLAQTGDLQGAVSLINKVRNRAGLSNLGERQNYKVDSNYTNSETNATIDFNSSDYGYPAFENNSLSYTLSDVMAVLDIENMKEAAFECERFVDLRRWGISSNSNFLSKVKKRSYKYYANFTPVRAWLPMPTDDVNNNPNLSQLLGW